MLVKSNRLLARNEKNLNNFFAPECTGYWRKSWLKCLANDICTYNTSCKICIHIGQLLIYFVYEQGGMKEGEIAADSGNQSPSIVAKRARRTIYVSPKALDSPPRESRYAAQGAFFSRKTLLHQ